jgi:DNA-binding HxlR family transcriptional regulator
MTADGEAVDADSTGRRPLRRATTILGKKWHPVLLQTLLADGPLGFNDIKARIDGISDKVLSESLADLQDAGLIAREVVEEQPVRVNYSLTPAGEELKPILEGLERWSRTHLAEAR